VSEPRPPGPEGFLPRSATCFVCGRDNEQGLGARFRRIDEHTVEVRTRFSDTKEGFPGVVHGGVQTAVLDETMGWAAACQAGVFAVTASLEVRFRHKLPTGLAVRIRGRFKESLRGRLLLAEGWIEDEAGTVYTRASGKFVPLPPEHTPDVESILLDEGDVPGLPWD
jgi:acyl-coenzyme A thioesterase PaaI-like protein